MNFQTNLFEQLASSVNFDDITNGRKGAVLVDVKDIGVPIVRTTTKYENPAHKFSDVHYLIVNEIKKVANIDGLELNNGLIELYDSRYTNMGFHSDQALDLAENSYICIFSCYDNGKATRKLIVKKKEQDKCEEIILDHNSVVIFSTEINSQYLHKIILDEKISSDNKWLGITFRLSKTFIKFENNVPYLSYNKLKPLVLATDVEKKEFYKCRSVENSTVKYDWKNIDYTISKSDLLPPI